MLFRSQLKQAEDPEQLKLTQKEQEARDRLLNDNQVQAGMNVIKGIRVFKQFANQG